MPSMYLSLNMRFIGAMTLVFLTSKVEAIHIGNVFWPFDSPAVTVTAPPAATVTAKPAVADSATEKMLKDKLGAFGFGNEAVMKDFSNKAMDAWAATMGIPGGKGPAPPPGAAKPPAKLIKTGEAKVIKDPTAAKVSAADPSTLTKALSPQMTGYLCCLIAVLGFGSNMIPVKKVQTGDGIFFALCMSFGILCVGALVGLMQGFPQIEAMAMLGGALWATGNVACVAIIQAIGLGPGVLTWGMMNMLTGWSIGKFGLLGQDKESIAYENVNLAGVGLAIASLALFSQVDTSSGEKKEVAEEESQSEGGNPFSGMPESARKLIGLGLSIVTGAFFGSNFTPPTLLLQQGKQDVAAGLTPRHSAQVLDYVFAHFLGIVVASLFWFIVYYFSMKKPFVSREVVLPALVSGILWGIAQVCWFKANDLLSFVVAFPIITSVPGAVAALWGVVLFKEIGTNPARMLLAVVIGLQFTAVTMIALSKNA